MSDTLNLDNNSQARILLAMLREGLHNKSEGMSGFDLKNECNIPYTSWSENYKRLELKSLIAPSLDPNSKIKRKKTRPRYPYVLTPLGVLSLLRYGVKYEITSKGKSNKKLSITLEEIKDSLPLIEVNWNLLHSLYEKGKYKNLLLQILQYSFDQLQLNSNGSGYESFVEEITTIYPDALSIHSLHLKRFYHIHYIKSGKYNVTRVNDLTTNLHFIEDYIDLSITPMDRLSFLFYYNLLRLARDNSFQLQILHMMDNTFQTTVKDHDKPTIEKKSVPFRKMLQRKERHLIALIHKDKHLNMIFQKCLNEINEKIASNSLLEKMNKEFLMSKPA